MSASAEYGATASIATRSMTSMALVGNRVSCIFFGIAGVLDAINTAQQDGFTVENVAMYTVEAGLWALECGAKVKAKKAPKSCKLQDAASMFITSSGTPANLRFMNSFVEGTKVLTKEGYKPIEAVRVGDLVASVDEKTGGEVYRKVVSTFNRQAPGTLSLILEDAAGNREVIETTPEHPFHTQGWDGKVETLVAALDGDAAAATVAPARLFPSSGKTPFGEWVKAGALKQGDSVSTSASMVKTAIANGGEMLKAANDNGSLTVAEIVRGNRTARVYNFEVESRAGEITNNYFVGNKEALAHNGKADAWNAVFNDPNTPKMIKGWMRQELNRGKKFWNMRTPPGCDLGHYPANRGSHGPNSRLEWTRDNRSRPNTTNNNTKWR